jgi:hypothetical protein
MRALSVVLIVVSGYGQAVDRQQLRRRYRREWLLTFSPGEWIWLAVTVVVFWGLLAV